MNESKAARNLRWLLLCLVILLTFEGLARKMVGGGLGVLIFLFKDILILFIGIQTIRARHPPVIDFFWSAYLLTILLFIPVIISTAAHDPVLAVFGVKEYLLYPVVAFGVFLAFEKSTPDEIIRFFGLVALLIIPTTIMSLVELRLPASHWLNLSVEGDSLEGFETSGHLRISSTFSFVAQYCIFLNVETFVIMIALNRLNQMTLLWKGVYLSLIPLLVMSCYATGSRGAVVGNTVIVLLALGLSLLRFDMRSAFRVGAVIGILLLVVVVAQYLFPDLFAGYSEREKGNLVGFSTEIQSRVYNSLFGWIGDSLSTPLLGYGIGIMSNGSDMISEYAATYRSKGYWTETDCATTLFEGGWYLVAVWYGFRFYVIFETAQRFLLNVRGNLSISGAFCQAFVIVVGFTGTLAIQPPVAIWWWFAIGTSLVLYWKSVEPAKDEKEIDLPPPPTKKTVRGRSAYAERLHGRR